ncbi:hypothetical protein F0L68_04220 [Solihabitans fulvus]|uniref:YjbR protein n=1 Tax=Solihabitans fulvus TaxID=1892852 RepID=A0A5B2XSR0_9PSEU|nr:hypothetical protein F0L68_04220 [Solihabitans fulvus]
MVTEEDVRRVALSLPATTEKPYNRLPGFRVRNSLFVRVHEQPEVIMIGCADLAEKDGLIASEPDKFFTTAHYDGYPALLVRLANIDLDELTELLTDCWRRAAPKRLLAEFDAAHPPA